MIELKIDAAQLLITSCDKLKFSISQNCPRKLFNETIYFSGLSLESLHSESESEIIECYKQAGEIALAVFVEGESSSMLKRSQAVGIPSNHLTPLLETSLLQPADLMYQHG